MQIPHLGNLRMVCYVLLPNAAIQSKSYEINL